MQKTTEPRTIARKAAYRAETELYGILAQLLFASAFYSKPQQFLVRPWEKDIEFNPSVLNSEQRFLSNLRAWRWPKRYRDEESHRKSNVLFQELAGLYIASDSRCAYWCTSYIAQKVEQKG